MHFRCIHWHLRRLGFGGPRRFRASCGSVLLLALLLASLLSGCAQMRENLLSPIPVTRKHVALSATAPLAIVGGQRYVGAGQKQDYMLLRGDAGQAELIYVSAISYQGLAALKYHGERLRQFSADWHINAGGMRDWGRAHGLTTPLAQFRYVPYTTGQPGRACAAFQALWDVPPGDEYKRPAKLIYGYYCANPGTALDSAVLRRFLASLRIGFYASADVGQAAIPELSARQHNGQTGYRSFPRLLPVYRRPLFDIR